MLKWLKSFSAVQVPFLRMVLWGFVAFVVSVTVLMQLGTHWHNNYEYYGDSPIFYGGPTLLAFITPDILAEWRRRSKTLKRGP